MSVVEEIKKKREKIEKEKDQEKLQNDFDLRQMDGVGDVRYKRLVEAGIKDLMGLVICDARQISRVTGMDEKRAFDMISKARTILSEKGTIKKSVLTGSEFEDIEKETTKYISAGCKNLDTLMTGGIKLRSLTELYGEFGSGKTQICHTVAVICTQPVEKGGLSGNIIWFNSERTYTPKRMRQIAEARGFIPSVKEEDFKKADGSWKDEDCYKKAMKEQDKAVKKMWDRITILEPHDSAHQIYMLDHIGDYIKPNTKLLIIDSITAMFRQEFLGRGELAERQNAIGQHLAKLQRIAQNYDLAVLYTNQVLSDPAKSWGDPTKPSGGHILGHTSTYRIYLKKSGSKKIAKMEDSPEHPQAEALYKLTLSGVEDADES